MGPWINIRSGHGSLASLMEKVVSTSFTSEGSSLPVSLSDSDAMIGKC